MDVVLVVLVVLVVDVVLVDVVEVVLVVVVVGPAVVVTGSGDVPTPISYARRLTVSRMKS